MRSPIGRWYAVVAALSVGLLVTGCGGDSSAAPSKEVFLQPVADRGPDPYTASTVRGNATPKPPPAAPSAAPSAPATAQTVRTFSGSTPGLYGGTQSIGSCDVEQQVRFLGSDQGKARAFARGAGIDQAAVPNFLRGLTPVVLRADTRVTNHGFRDGSSTSYQSVLQAGTAVLVDQYGAPRVRCACGNPLKPPVAVKGAVVHKGKPWAGYRADRVIVIKPTVQVVNNFVIVDIVDNTWIERKTGSDGEEDRRPDVLPPVDPDDVFTDPAAPDPDGSADPGDSTGPGEPTGPSEPGAGTSDPSTPDCPTPTMTTLEPGEEPPPTPSVPAGCPTPSWTQPEPPPVDPPVGPPVDPPVNPDMPPGQDVAPSEPDLLIPSEEPVPPDTFQG